MNAEDTEADTPSGESQTSRSKVVALRIGEVLNLKVRTGHAITLAATASFLFGMMAYAQKVTETPGSSAVSASIASTEWVKKVDKHITDSGTGYQRISLLEANQVSLLDNQKEQGKDIREMRDDIRAIRNLLEGSRAR